MKRSYLVLFLVLFIFGVVSAQSIKVLTPKKESVLCNDCQMMIVWSKTGNMNDILKIRLFNSSGTVKVAEIDNYFDSKDKNYTKWTISGNIKGGMYIVRVMRIDDHVRGDSEVFEIKGPVKKRLINLSNNDFQIGQPDSTSVWYKNNCWNITWEPNGSANDAVGIYLINYFKPVVIHEIKGNCQNNLHYTWCIPKTFSKGRYRIKIVNKVSGEIAISKIFKIKDKLALKIVE